MHTQIVTAARRFMGLAAVPLLTACSGGSSGGGDPPGNPRVNGLTVDGGTTGGDPTMIGAGCNTVTNGAGMIAWTTSPDAAPKPTGGTVASGTYFLTSLISYGVMGNACKGAASGLQAQSTLVVDASAMTVQGITAARGMLGSATSLSNGMFSVSVPGGGTGVPNLRFTSTCGAMSFDPFNGVDFSYTATGSALTLFEDEGASDCGTIAEVFTKQ